MEVKIARLKKQLTQKELCKKVRISIKKLVDAERGNYDRLTFSNMKDLSAELNTSINDLFFHQDN